MQTKLSFSLIFDQTLNFAKNRFWQVIIVSVLLGAFNVAVTNYFIDKDAINSFSTTGDPSLAFSAIGSLLLGVTLSALVITSVSTMIVYNLSISNQFNANIFFSRIISTILKILGFNVLYTFIIFFVALILGLVLFILQLISPNLGSILILIAGLFLVFFMMTIYNFFIGSIVAPSSKSFFQQFSDCHQLAKAYWKLGIGMIFINIMFLLVISGIAMYTPQDNIAIDIVFSSLSIFVDIFVICFFYRLYVLVSEQGTQIDNRMNDETNLTL